MTAHNFLPSLTDAQSTLVVAILSAGFAAAGFVAKLLVESVRSAYERHQGRVAKLVELDGLLRASNAVYEIQNELARRLVETVHTTQPALAVPEPGGFESTFAAAYPGMNQDEKSLQGIIRSMSENAVKPLNDAMLEWLKADAYWKSRRRWGPKTQLAQSLARLEAHLYLWRAKYAYWMKDPRHALVYLADEEAHGLGFPKELDGRVKDILKRKSDEDAVPTRKRD